MTIAGTEPRPVAFYLLDWDANERSQLVEVFDFATGALLHSLPVNAFNQGKYLIYSLSGDVRVRFTRLNGFNAVLSGIFFPTESDPVAPIAAPTIQPNGGLFTNSTTVTLHTTTPDAAIYYTVNGSDPSASSQLYTGPFQVTSSITLKAIGTKSGMADSSISTAVFTKADSTPSPVGLVRRDTATGGNWIGAYGQEGYIVFQRFSAFHQWSQRPVDRWPDLDLELSNG